MGDPVWILLHVLVLVYWLGGDLGAFYASRLVADVTRPAAGRMAAASILLNIDMAPRMALIFALPTGLAAAIARGWLDLAVGWIALAFGLAALWAGLAWIVHLKTGPVTLARRLDLAIRYAVMFGLAGTALTAFAGVYDLPLFITLKLALLALAIACGLLIRRVLAPFGPAFARLAGGKAGPEDDAAIRNSLAHAKLYVLTLWGALLAAAALGLYTPA